MNVHTSTTERDTAPVLAAALMTTRNKGVLLNYATKTRRARLEKRISKPKKASDIDAPKSLWHSWRESIKQTDENGAPNSGSG